MAEGAAPPVVAAAALSAAFITALRRAGLSCSPDRAVRLAEALHLVPPSDVEPLYWTSRVVLVSTREQLPVFDAVFSAVFRGGFDPAAQLLGAGAPAAGLEEAHTRPSPGDNRATPIEQPRQRSHPAVASAGAEGPPGRDPSEREAMLAAASTDEHLHEMSFAALSSEEVRDIRSLVARLLLATPARLSRRTRKSAHSSARLDIRATVRAARMSGSDTTRLLYARRREQRRKLVLLCDVSGSMEPYARVFVSLLQGSVASAGAEAFVFSTRLLYARRREQRRKLVLLCDVSGSMEPYARVFVSLLQGSVASAGAEAFVFSTRLTRLTRQLSLRDPDEALARAAATAPDWAGGTRIADSLRRFVDEHGRRGLARGAVVVIFSDGWAQEDPEQVGAQMARLRRLAYRVIWVNPRKAAPGYQPLVGGMAAALPYCDAFVSGHSYTALVELAAAIRGDGQSSFERQRTS